MPELMDRASMRAARDLCNKAPGPYGPILQHVKVISKEGAAVDIPIAHPFALLHACLSASDGMQAFFQQNAPAEFTNT